METNQTQAQSTNESATPEATSSNGRALIPSVVDQLCAESRAIVSLRTRPGIRHEFPSRVSLIQLVEELRSVLFPGYFGPSELSSESVRFHLGAALDRVLHGMAEQIKRGFCAECEEHDIESCEGCDQRAFAAAVSFIERLPTVRRMLATDVMAAYEGDPAATSPDEAIFSYPGISAITNYRIAHELLLLKVPLIPRIITELAHSTTGIDIHPGATIGERFFIDHGTGVVIGETCVIGRNVRLYQGVTLGAKSFPLDEHGNPIKGIPRHPVVEDDVIIYSGATVLGRVTIGKGSTVGGNVWLTRSVPPGSSITQAQQKPERHESGPGV
jgi:serine O-acetyltransferase